MNESYKPQPDGSSFLEPEKMVQEKLNILTWNGYGVRYHIEDAGSFVSSVRLQEDVAAFNPNVDAILPPEYAFEPIYQPVFILKFDSQGVPDSFVIPSLEQVYGYPEGTIHKSQLTFSLFHSKDTNIVFSFDIEHPFIDTPERYEVGWQMILPPQYGRRPKTDLRFAFKPEENGILIPDRWYI